MSHSDIFDQKRFSNIENSGSQAPYCSQLLSTQPKRYSNIETSSFESKKRIENGRVVYDVSDSKRESFVDGEKPNGNSLLHFPVKEPATASTTTPTTTEATQWPPSVNAAAAQHTNIGSTNGKVAEPPAVATSNVGEIMSALNLNTSAAAPTHADVATHSAASNTTTTTTKTEETHEKSEKSINSQHGENSTFNKNISSTYEEFRQRAKAAAEAAATATTPFTAPAMTTSDHKQSSTSSSSSVFHFDHEKLFKDFDDLSKQLNVELEHGKTQKEQREKSASLYDLSRMQTESKTRFDELKRQRHDHMQELEREIERSRRSRQFRVPMQLENDPSRRQSMPRTFEIPIRIENGLEHQAPASAPVTNEHEPRTYEIPVHVEPHYTVTSPMPADYADAARFRRAESMFNLSDNQQQQQHYRQRTASNSQTDDWTRYASDLGSSENITRPFAREVEICYQRCRPQVIRAPRMSVSTNDLSSTTSQSQSYDAYNAYNVRRTHAPMLSQVPQKSKPQYLSCHSMIERNPNPTYISTTSRRGVSPAPATPTSPAAAPYTAADNSRDGDVRQRRASLPREIHEQQLKYIASKEQELKTEFERLEHERRRLLEEMQRAPAMSVSPRVMRESYRPAPKLPTLSEDEVFRQQMAEEWLSKVAEREERRLHKIIKISKINEEAAAGLNFPAPPACPKVDIGDEFLKRVKERRSKLAMPTDSDWESGAESQPAAAPGHVSEGEEMPPIKIIEGKAETDLRQLPKHLREFAKFSNHQREELDGGHREVHEEEERRQEANDNSTSSAIKKSSIVKTYKVSRCPGGGQSQAQLQRAANAARQPPHMTAASKEEALNGTDAFTSPFFETKFPLPASFSEMFAASPFKSRIYDEFDSYWRNFDFV